MNFLRRLLTPPRERVRYSHTVAPPEKLDAVGHRARIEATLAVKDAMRGGPAEYWWLGGERRREPGRERFLRELTRDRDGGRPSASSANLIGDSLVKPLD